MDIFDWILSIAVVVVIAMAVFVTVAIYSSIQHTNRLMDECRKDHKEYECENMLRSHSSDVVIRPMQLFFRFRNKSKMNPIVLLASIRWNGLLNNHPKDYVEVSKAIDAYLNTLDRKQKQAFWHEVDLFTIGHIKE